LCGVTGIVSNSSRYNTERNKEKWLPQLNQMIQAIQHRGKDGSGFYIDDQGICFLGHTRLSILDLRSVANQPMCSDDGRFVISFNGEIYNYKELRILLEKEGIKFRTNSDTEVLLYSYQVLGKNCLDKLRGIFAFAIWDNLTRKLFAARDHLGVKPFYWFYQKIEGEDVFLFASELKAILSNSFVDRKINLNAFYNYLSFYSINPPDSLIKNIYQLEPGNFLELDSVGLNIEKYWDLQKFKTNEELKDLSQIKTKLREKLLQTIDLQMRSDVDVGAFLSGGLDSATIVGLMSQVTDKKVHTFNISFGAEGQYIDESKLAKNVAIKFGCQHHEVKVSSKEFKDSFEDFIIAIDQPSGDGINSFFVSKFTAQHVKVALCGLGGDEVFLGYRYFQDLVKQQSYQKHFLKNKFLPAFSCFYNNNRLFRSFAYRNKMNFLKFWPAQKEDFYFKSRTLFDAKEQRKLLKNAFVYEPKPWQKFVKNIFDAEKDSLNAFSKAELCWYTPGILLRDSDATSMASTLEVRVPFLDHELVEFLVQIPSQFKIHLNQKVNKPLLANLFDNLLPEQILTYPKRGFEMPIGFWLQDCFSKELDDLRNVRWLNRNQVDKLLSQFNKDPKQYLKVWSLIVLNSWLQEYKVEFACEQEKNFVCSSW